MTRDKVIVCGIGDSCSGWCLGEEEGKVAVVGTGVSDVHVCCWR